MSDDFLDEMIAERTAMDPEFLAVFDAAVRRRQAEAEQVADRASDPK